MTQLRPRFCKLLASIAAQHHPGFAYTTSIYCNEDYANKMHVDANTRGPSLITAFSQYSGGELWVFDPAGDTTQEVRQSMLAGRVSLDE